jgi:subtilisin family serine protease
MRRRRLIAVCGAAALATAALAGTAGASSASGATAQVVNTGQQQSYLVLTRTTADVHDVAAALARQGATVTSVNKAIGMVAVRSDDAGFRATATSLDGVSGVAADRTIGQAPTRDTGAVERENLRAARSGATVGASSSGAAASSGDPLDSQLWGMRMIGADQAHATTLGSPKVRVGIMDTGVQADHPDLHAQFDYGLSRNFTRDNDNGVDDGPCEVSSCVDPVGTDDNGHGTHVAGTVAGAMNGFGVSGVAPDSTIVEVRAGQDSGYFFAIPTVNALTYAGDAGLDVVNMSFYVDPWLYNCSGGAPEDTPEQAADQDTIIAAMTRALDYAHGQGVTLVAATGNNHEDLANPRTDTSSPDYGDAPHSRTIDNQTCFDLPVEGPHVLGVTALGPSGRKSDFSNYTTEPTSDEVEVSAPGGWFRDGLGTSSYRTNENLILSSFPLGALQESGEVDKNGRITRLGKSTGVIRQCQAEPIPGTTACAYFAWLQGTSMATPHATGVAALAVAAHGSGTSAADFGLDPGAVGSLLQRTATDHACPAGGTQSYLDVGRSAEFTATCVGTARRNGFYGEGIVNALGVVQ